ncbi:armadillo repeat-containing protein 2-like isoform X2 [Limulus polyphemus]|uniref:Armadillo repeat-containing protein 2-like isoform X2 n=1 Tax=Limulus polyphemus TaxID=6850 RepID=A0ABM1SFI7_LIMPO|nr:armadillo repeat-containing protein 2-like isoform X2 [Limulus polyphemus]
MKMNKSSKRPFYALPKNRKTSAEIVSEARAAIRSVETKRPFTPAEKKRLQNESPLLHRRPSISSIDALQYDPLESRPTTGVKLIPLRGKKLEPIAKQVPIVNLDRSKPTRNDHNNGMNHCFGYTVKENIIKTETEREKFKENSQDFFEESSRDVHENKQPGHCLKKRNITVRRRASGDTTKQDVDIGILKNVKDGTIPDNGYVKQKDPETQKLVQRLTALMEQLNMDRYEDKTDPHVEKVLQQLYRLLEESGLKEQSFKLRSSLLRVLYKLLDPAQPQKSLLVARVIFQLKVSGRNLTSVCKAVYKISKEEKNDSLFLSTKCLATYLAFVQTIHPEVTSDAMMYITATWKLLSGNEKLRNYLLKKGCLEFLLYQLNNLNIMIQNGGDGEIYSSILVQLTGTLRNLAENDFSQQALVKECAMKDMCLTLQLCQNDKDVVLNIIRTLSKLTVLQQSCEMLLVCGSSCLILMDLLQQHKQNQDIVVRVFFILGNLAAWDENVGLIIYEVPCSLNNLLAILDYYIQLKIKVKQETERIAEGTCCGIPPRDCEDVLVKAVRLIANMSLNKEAGNHLAACDTLWDILLRIIDSREMEGGEELVLTTLICLNNLSYYLSTENHFTSSKAVAAKCILPLLLDTKEDICLEVCRIFGNLTRFSLVRNFLVTSKALSILVNLVETRITELLLAVCGILVNILGDDDKKEPFCQLKGVPKLLDILEDIGQQDWTLSGLVSQVLWNYCCGPGSSIDCLTKLEKDRLMSLLEKLIYKYEEETCLGDEDSSLMVVSETCFSSVASQLLDVISIWPS